MLLEKEVTGSIPHPGQMLPLIALPSEVKRVTDASIFLGIDLPPFSNSPDSSVRYKSFLTSPGRTTSGNPFFPVRQITFWKTTGFSCDT